MLPSAYEANALVVLEALASGLPVIATPVGFAPEIIADGENGCLVERDGRRVGERMEQLANLDDAELAQWSRNARATAERYGWRSVAQHYLELVEQLRAERDDEQHAARAAAKRTTG